MKLLLAVACLVPFFLASGPSNAAPARDLLTDYLAGPLGVDTRSPGFSWRMDDSRRGVVQTAYQIQVATSRALLDSGRPDMWDSGKVRSRASVAIPYGGKQLKSRTAYYWRVRLWDGKGSAGEFSKPASFETGMLDRKDWRAGWVAVPLPSGNGYHSEFGASVDDAKWVQIDLGKSAPFASIMLYPARPYNWQRDEPGFGFPVRYRVDVSDDPDFTSARTIADRTDADQPNPATEPVKIPVGDQTARYVRITATKLHHPSGTKPLFALAEMEVLDAQRRNLATNAAVRARDSIEGSDWSARKLTDGDPVSHASSNVSPILRREFAVLKPIARARAYVTGLGYCELYLNGRKVGDRVLDPPRTEYGKRVCYSTYDVKEYLADGHNCAGAMLGRGWWGENPRFLLQIEIDYTDGSRQTVVSDGGWKWAEGPIRENTLYNGETFDARLDPRGWGKPGFDDSAWKPVGEIEVSNVALSAEDIQPIEVVETLPAKSITSPTPGVWVVDFGQNFSGWCHIKVAAPIGTRVTLKHAELLREDGTVNQDNLRSARATDIYITRGVGAETYEPRFTYHGFRYVQVEGYPGALKPSVIQGRVVCTALEPRGTFECSNELLNQIQHNAWWGERTNFHSIPTDCPQRDERQGWMGDAWISALAMCYNFDMPAAYTKFLRDIVDAQRADGAVPDTVPHVWGEMMGDPMWSAAYPMLLWETYLHTGDKRLLAEHYEGAKRSVDVLKREALGYIVSHNFYGDWIAVEGTPKDLISTGTFCWLTGVIADMADALGKPSDAVAYRELRKSIADAFNAKFLNSDTGSYGNGSQFSNAFPLYLEIVPADKRDRVLRNLVDDIEIKSKGHLSTGFVGTPFLLDALMKCGRADLAYGIVSQKDYPGWGYMVANGATTTWELWQLQTGNGMNSHNHPALGFVSAWFYQVLAGLEPDPRFPGWERFTVKPHMLGDLKWARASVDTVRGRVESDWRLTDKGITLAVTIPANSAATVCVPTLGALRQAQNDCVVKEGDSIIWNRGAFRPTAAGVRSGRLRDGWIEFEVSSGRYVFELR